MFWSDLLKANNYSFLSEAYLAKTVVHPSRSLNGASSIVICFFLKLNLIIVFGSFEVLCDWLNRVVLVYAARQIFIGKSTPVVSYRLYMLLNELSIFFN
jgi:hypothetical protein